MADDLALRTDVSDSQLLLLEILCDNYVEYGEVKAVVAKDGYTVEVISKNGLSIKTSPYVTQLDKILGHINTYSKALGLHISKQSVEKATEEEENWSY